MHRKIEFWETVAASFRFVFSDWGRFFRLAGPWIAIGIVLAVLTALLFGVGAVSAFLKGRGVHPPTGFGWIRLVVDLYSAIAYTAFAVAWHRAVLLDEGSSVVFRFRRREIRFLLYYIGVALIWFAVVAVFVLVGIGLGVAVFAGHAGGDLSNARGQGFGLYAGLGGAVAFIAVIAVVPFIARLTLGLPAIAVEEPAGVFRRAWHRGWHNGWRLVWGGVFSALPAVIVSGLLFGAGILMIFVIALGGVWHFVGYAGAIMFDALGIAGYFMALATAITFLSLSYRQLSADEPALPRA